MRGIRAEFLKAPLTAEHAFLAGVRKPMFCARNPYFHSADGIELFATLKIGFGSILMRIMHGRLNLTRCGASNEFGAHGLQSFDA